MAAFFLFTGLETTAGQWCFSLLRERHGLGVEGAGAWTSAYWASLTLGRIALGFVVDRVGSDRLLRMASVGMLAGAALFAAREDLVGRSGLLLLGLSLAPVFPTLMARTPARLGAASRLAVGFQVSAATLGSASMPALAGFLVARFGLGIVPIFALVLALGYGAVHELVLAMTRRVEARAI
jgi:fucose permease